MKKKSTLKVNLKRSKDGGSLEFNSMERSFGAISRKSEKMEYIYGVIPLKIMKPG